MNLIMYQPDIPQNVGSFIRLAACTGAVLHIVEPCGFPVDDRRIARVAMDYAAQASVIRHRSWQAFLGFRQSMPAARLLALTTKAQCAYTDFRFEADDCLLFGQESAGLPQEIARAADARLRIPMHRQARSLNVALAAAMALGEGLRQTNQFPKG